MKVGSIVECIDNTGFEDRVSLNTPYTVREILPKGSVLKTDLPVEAITHEVTIRLEELNEDIIVTGFGRSIKIFDAPYVIVRFRELLPPMSIDLEEIISSTNPVAL